MQLVPERLFPRAGANGSVATRTHSIDAERSRQPPSLPLVEFRSRVSYAREDRGQSGSAKNLAVFLGSTFSFAASWLDQNQPVPVDMSRSPYLDLAAMIRIALQQIDALHAFPSREDISMMLMSADTAIRSINRGRRYRTMVMSALLSAARTLSGLPVHSIPQTVPMSASGGSMSLALRPDSHSWQQLWFHPVSRAQSSLISCLGTGS